MKYKRIAVTEFGGSDVLKLVELEIPEPGPGQVRIKIEAAGVAFADIMLRKGLYMPQPKAPFTPGYDFAGTVDKVGEGVTAFTPGQKAGRVTVTGSYSEYIVYDADQLYPIPDDVDSMDAVCMLLNYITAYQMLKRVAKVEPGQTILVQGAGGGVGTALLQLAAVWDIKAIGVASGSKKETVESFGATHIDYTKEDFVVRAAELVPGGIDAAFDAISLESVKRSAQTVKREGSVVAYGMLEDVRSGKVNAIGSMFGIIGLTMSNLVPGGPKKTFYAINPSKGHENCKADYAELIKLYQDGKIKPLIAQKFPLEKAAEAQDLLESGGAAGKILLVR